MKHADPLRAACVVKQLFIFLRLVYFFAQASSYLHQFFQEVTPRHMKQFSFFFKITAIKKKKKYNTAIDKHDICVSKQSIDLEKTKTHIDRHTHMHTH